MGTRVEVFQDTLFSIFDQSFPQKSKIVTNKDEPWYNEALKKLRKNKPKWLRSRDMHCSLLLLLRYNDAIVY